MLAGAGRAAEHHPKPPCCSLLRPPPCECWNLLCQTAPSSSGQFCPRRCHHTAWAGLGGFGWVPPQELVAFQQGQTKREALPLPSSAGHQNQCQSFKNPSASTKCQSLLKVREPTERALTRPAGEPGAGAAAATLPVQAGIWSTSNGSQSRAALLASRSLLASGLWTLSSSATPLFSRRSH